MPSEPVKLNLEAEAIQEVIDLARTADRLPEMLAAVDQVGVQVGASPVAWRVAKKMNLPFLMVRNALSTLLNIHNIRQRMSLSAEAIVEAIVNNLSSEAKTPEDKENLQFLERGKVAIAQAVALLNKDHPLVVSYIALGVAQSRPNVVVSIDVSTDARPVFNDSGDKVLLTIISHVLSLEYHEGPGHREIHLSLDAEDLAILGYLCFDAQEKAAIFKRGLKNAPWPTSILQENTDVDTDSENGK